VLRLVAQVKARARRVLVTRPCRGCRRTTRCLAQQRGGNPRCATAAPDDLVTRTADEGEALLRLQPA
jgi:hypothetical protein